MRAGAAYPLDALPVPERGPAQIELFYLDLDMQAAELPDCEAVLSESERARAERYAFAHLKTRFLLRRGILRRLLARWSGIAAEDIAFATGPQGKPYGTDARLPHFNLSDSGAHLAIALCWDHSLGVDIEAYRQFDDLDGLVAQTLTPRERAAFAALPSGARDKVFLRLWTAKEAVMKALGTGLTRPPESIEIALAPETPRGLKSVDAGGSGSWSVGEISFSPDLLIALAVPTSATQIRLWHARESALFCVAQYSFHRIDISF